MLASPESSKWAFILGHPGHELRVLRWLEQTKPLVIVLTDGSGHDGPSRLSLTARLLERAGARISTLYGVMTDQELYRAILERNIEKFTDLADRIAELLVNHEIDCVAGDEIEGYNPAHDLCRLLIDRAVSIAAHRARRNISNFSFALAGAPNTAELPSGALPLVLNSTQLTHKLVASRRYAGEAGGSLVAEVERMSQDFGDAAFNHEVLYPANTAAALARFHREAPFYESHGKKRVAAGRYAEIIRFRQHIVPIADALTAPI